ncbi:ribbon-helix-helix domain-containing protein [Limoniibacter endophyticus]|uniref:Aryl-sulfate sulfotransferase n=1 Tax=Limoniibacter endophyticus TaxID=1565040 RepID=A0A8J3GI77_9HYPH|nr:ribbon-helix-helix domain-containing protein [Limoniibacter endophyticus]GHC75338.1 aryl-sulfate sulfotransferase [Limoniibacter endophyticus]
MTALRKYSVSLRGHRTSFTLEPEFHAELKAIAEERKLALAALIFEIDTEREEKVNLSSALRLFVLRSLKKSA